MTGGGDRYNFSVQTPEDYSIRFIKFMNKIIEEDKE